jgi:hypothetical protein
MPSSTSLLILVTSSELLPVGSASGQNASSLNPPLCSAVHTKHKHDAVSSGYVQAYTLCGP